MKAFANIVFGTITMEVEKTITPLIWDINGNRIKPTGEKHNRKEKP